MKPLLEVYPPNSILGGRCFVGTARILLINEFKDGSAAVLVDDDRAGTYMTKREWLDECLNA